MSQHSSGPPGNRTQTPPSSAALSPEDCPCPSTVSPAQPAAGSEWQLHLWLMHLEMPQPGESCRIPRESTWFLSLIFQSLPGECHHPYYPCGITSKPGFRGVKWAHLSAEGHLCRLYRTPCAVHQQSFAAEDSPVSFPSHMHTSSTMAKRARGDSCLIFLFHLTSRDQEYQWGLKNAAWRRHPHDQSSLAQGISIFHYFFFAPFHQCWSSL